MRPNSEKNTKNDDLETPVSGKENMLDNENDSVGGYSVPQDPMDLLQCDSCQ